MFNLRFTVAIIALAAIVACCGGGGSGTPTGNVRYSATDLQGVWRANSLASGPGAPWWERAQVTIAADGGVSGTATDSSGGSGTISGVVLNISTGGVVTQAGSSTFGGFMDAGKTVMVGTDTVSSLPQRMATSIAPLCIATVARRRLVVPSTSRPTVL